MAEKWSHQKRVAFEEAFREFLDNVYINSKDLGGHTCLGAHLYDAQLRLLTEIMDGLEKGVHNFLVLKSRQLGISTFSRALSVFYLGVHDGLQGATVFDTDANKSVARKEIESMIDNLPPRVKFPRIKSRNRDGLVLANESSLRFMSAGVRASKGSGVLGRSLGLSFAHLSEICSYDAGEGIEAFKQSLSEVNPDRLYIWESTARGFNIWNDMWMEAKADPTHSGCVFLGWYMKPSQQIDRGDADFERYGLQPPTESELKKIAEVKRRYDWSITPEQLAWVRRKMDPTAKAEGDAPVEYVGDIVKTQEQPWTEDEAFQMPGATFFAPEKLAEQATTHVSKDFKTYYYSTGMEFEDCRVYKSFNQKSVMLKVWEEPVEEAIYVIAADPAYGHSDRSDRSAIQVLRAYADGLDQVAEYAWPLINTEQFAWVIASLQGWYAGDKSEVYQILELNGPGEAVWNGLKSLKHRVENTLVRPAEGEGDSVVNIFRNVRNFIYTRADSMSPGHVYHWKTHSMNKIPLMERLRDFTQNGLLRIRSIETLEEMRSVTREGDGIAARGNKKDDRVVTMALAVQCWENRVRRNMIAQRRTRESEAAKRKVSVQDQVKLYNGNMFDQFIAQRVNTRARQEASVRSLGWRARTR